MMCKCSLCRSTPGFFDHIITSEFDGYRRRYKTGQDELLIEITYLPREQRRRGAHREAWAWDLTPSGEMPVARGGADSPEEAALQSFIALLNIVEES